MRLQSDGESWNCRRRVHPMWRLSDDSCGLVITNRWARQAGLSQIVRMTGRLSMTRMFAPMTQTRSLLSDGELCRGSNLDEGLLRDKVGPFRHFVLMSNYQATIAWQRSILPFCRLFVCLSVTFMHCAQTSKDVDTISFAYDSPMSLPDSVKFGLHSWTPSSQFFAPKWPILFVVCGFNI